MDSILFNNIASAASSVSPPVESEKSAALYGPAVVKIYNVYCMDININKEPFINNACNGGLMGSGFFVSQDGYIATNGHVASDDIKGFAIQFSIDAYKKGDTKYFEYLVSLTNLQPSDLNGKDDTANLAIVINGIYDISDSTFSKTNDVQNLLVDLSDKSPDLDALLTDTTNRKKYPVQNAIKSAELIASDYRSLDGIDGFKASDVAIIKVDGKNYPITKLGSISDVSQGSDLFILGYPGEATDNGLVDSTSNLVTLTDGKVSSIKDASGSSKKLIETTATIAHGNSGGPALSEKGNVVGIATYTIDGSGTGNGVYNYIRDIKDLKDLASDSNIKFDTNSKTQSEWSKGLDYFYTAHYSKSIENFKTVKSLYPYNSKVDEFITKANKGIENGEDVQDFPIIPVVIASVIGLIGAGVMVFVIIRHNKRHGIYKQQVLSGSMSPFNPTTPIQQVVVPAQPIWKDNNTVPNSAVLSTPVISPVISIPVSSSPPESPIKPMDQNNQ